MGSGVHGDVERVSADNLVQMGRVCHARVYERVDTVNNYCYPQSVLIPSYAKQGS